MIVVTAMARWIGMAEANIGAANLGTRALGTSRVWLNSCGVKKAICLLCVLFAGIARDVQGTTLPTTVTEAPATSTTQTASAPAPSVPAVSPTISYVGGQLRISALDSTLAELLTRVAVLTGVNIDIPAGVGGERMAVIELGPGPPRQILAQLLSDSNCDFLIQALDTDPGRIQSVLLMQREKKGSRANAMDAAARPLVIPYARVAAPPVKPDEPVSENALPAPPENPAAEANPQNPQSAATQPDQPAQSPLSQPEQPTSTRPGALTPPQTLNSQTINSQLQQMYQQRSQMVQQERQAVVPAPPANPGNN
jgi:hypothetical protein